MPGHLLEYVQTWRHHHPSWEMALWTEQNLPMLRNDHYFRHADRYAPGSEGQLKADLARYEILHTLGGVWVDADFECLKPIDRLLEGVELFAAWEEQGVWVNNAILGSVPQHPLLNDMIMLAPRAIEDNQGQRPNAMTGPQLLTKVYKAQYRETPGVSIFPQRQFYPYSYRELDRADEDFPWAHAVHHWHNARKRASS
jgi:mannosyltransferase OCH1-like enzyme